MRLVIIGENRGGAVALLGDLVRDGHHRIFGGLAGLPPRLGDQALNQPRQIVGRRISRQRLERRRADNLGRIVRRVEELRDGCRVVPRAERPHEFRPNAGIVAAHPSQDGLVDVGAAKLGHGLAGGGAFVIP